MLLLKALNVIWLQVPLSVRLNALDCTGQGQHDSSQVGTFQVSVGVKTPYLPKENAIDRFSV